MLWKYSRVSVWCNYRGSNKWRHCVILVGTNAIVFVVFPFAISRSTHKVSLIADETKFCLSVLGVFLLLSLVLSNDNVAHFFSDPLPCLRLTTSRNNYLHTSCKERLYCTKLGR
jgi:hypothetical protein